MAYYEENKESINPVRKEKNREIRAKNQILCPHCDTPFVKRGRAYVCPACRPEETRRQQKLLDARRRPPKGTKRLEWTEEELRRAAELRAEGRCYREIAEAIGRSTLGVKQKMLRVAR
jgi:hypothetical protein